MHPCTLFGGVWRIRGYVHDGRLGASTLVAGQRDRRSALIVLQWLIKRLSFTDGMF